MRVNKPALTACAAAFALLAAGAASAQTTIIEREEPAVVVRERPAAVIERREVERVPAPVGGCESTTVTRSNDDGESTTVRKERCD